MNDSLDLFARTGDGVWAVDTDRRIVLWNQAAEELLGYTAEEAIGQTCYQLLRGRDPAGRPHCKAGCPARAHTQQGQAVESFNLQVRHRDGTASWINVSVVAVPEAHGASQDVALVHLFRQIADGAIWPPPLRIYLLGSVAVERAGGSPVEGPLWRRAKVRALLTVLALHKGQPVRRETLIETLWPDLEYSAALHNLNTTVYNLRRCLEPALQRGPSSQYIHYEGECYLLGGGRTHWLDVDAFESAIAQAHQQRDPGRARALYQDALALYRGDFVADLEPDRVGGWMERERLRELYMNTLEALAALCARQGQDGEAGELYLKVLAVDACRESATRRLMRLALRHGDRAEAVAHYQRLERALRRELGIVPGEETRLLYDEARAEGIN